MKKITCGFIGLGLIGGSIAKALKTRRKDVRIVAFDKNPDALLAARQDGVIDAAAEGADSSFAQCDLLFLCAPVACNEENLARLKDRISPDCILTDVGSVKTGIHERVAALGLEKQFIGGHPMTGSERFGYLNSKARLLENAYYILTPTKETAAEKLDFYKELALSLGALPLVMDYRQHDYVTGAVSHLPHVLAAALVNFVRDTDSPDGIMKMIAAGGFKDITRIASSSTDMWQQICLTNTVNISGLLGRYIDSLKEIRVQIDAGAGQDIYEFFRSARVYRDSFPEASSGPIKKEYALYADIPDEPGAIASIATLLALNGINIKNIGITHNREFEEGILRMEFYGEDGMDRAASLLEKKNYTIHRKK